MLLSKVKVIIGVVLLSGVIAGTAATAAMNRSDNASLAGNGATSSYTDQKESGKYKEKSLLKNDHRVLVNEKSQEASVKDLSKNNKNVNNQNVLSNKLITKEINCTKMGLSFVMDVPESWEGKYYVNEYSLFYGASTDTVSEKTEEKFIEVTFKDPETGFEFPLFTIMKKGNISLDEVGLDNTIVKNFNGQEYIIGGPTGSFDEPKVSFDRYMKMHDESIAVMNSVRTK